MLFYKMNIREKIVKTRICNAKSTYYKEVERCKKYSKDLWKVVRKMWAGKRIKKHKQY